MLKFSFRPVGCDISKAALQMIIRTKGFVNRVSFYPQILRNQCSITKMEGKKLLTNYGR